ncbi:transcriptional regulator GcvA [Pseudoroseicyclus aestuarii]|uniref:DNA-binding transcriptional LysR family regulator n=1 Tax=Pseudoroseicyclus aestuarii TaxID=1795041 RepID=A0A318SQ58_9RHOB|nr:transcriptional regulator GcvA [Pseudoroseicyclus aestuarii]PYE82488.1 DNA-binding transcriptional LysR family regulator [Pseudoroseicyclus aestuarii]
MAGRTLPSLNALRSFEAAARHGSFTRAAEELNVTQSAASRMVRSLEDYLEIELFTRRSRVIELTEQGRYYAGLLSDAMNRIEAGTLELTSTRAGTGTLTVGIVPSFGTKWMIPRLNSFQQRHPDISLNIVASDGPSVEDDKTIDTAIRFGYGEWPDHVAQPIMSEEMQVVCSPRIMDGPYPLVDYEMLRRHTLIVHSTRPRAWDHWFRSTGIDPAAMTWGLKLEHFFMVLQAAVSGLGVALLPTFLVETDIASGNLVAPFPVRVNGPGGYYLVTPEGKSDLPRVRAFRRWLAQEARDA